MKIVLDCERMKYPNTGLYTFCERLSAALRDIISDEDHLSLYIYPQTGHFLGNDVVYINRNLAHKLFSVRSKEADIWHTTYQLSKYYGGGKNTKNVLTVHDLNFLYEKKNPQKIRKYIKKHQERIDRADHIVAISEFTKKDILENLNVKEKPISVIHNGCDVIEYKGFDSPSYKPANPYIFTIGTIIPKKNFHVLPPLLRDNNYELLIAGVTSNYTERIMEEAILYAVEDRVKILGPISEEEKYWYLKNCLAFAFPSLAEGFGFPAIEAMYFGKPVFLSTLTSLPEIGGEYAYYFNNFDADHMRNTFQNGMNDYTENISKKDLIIKHAKQFSWEVCARKYYEVYQGLVNIY